MILLGVDTGGTFTDFIFKHDNKWEVYKILSTPSNPAKAVLDGIEHIAGEKALKIVHGSTVATNAILERKGAKTALITNKGFEDIIEIGRQNRNELYNLFYKKPPLLIPRSMRFGLNCRIDHSGTCLQDIDPDELKEIVQKLYQTGVESIAVSFLFSFNNPEHEQKTKQAILSKLDIPVSLSHEILAEFREFERTSTTVINAYVSPKMNNYINFIANQIGHDNLRIMQSNGGSISAQTAMQESVRTILSGPAGGAVGAYEISKIAGYNKIITFDMGGTSTDVALIDNKLPLTLESSIAQYPVKVPMIDIHTVGAGGGSIAFIDSGGSLKVGPESAGADPGPLCYGKGENITVTDANLFLGRLIPENFLGGNMKLHTDKLESCFEKMAKQTGLSSVELAEGIIAVANTAMERAIRVISIEKGFNPSEFSLFSFGGAGGMHAVFLAQLLNIPRIIIPENPGILSAIGMLLSDVIKDYSQTVMIEQDNFDIQLLEDLFKPFVQKGINDLIAEGIKEENILIEKYLDMRYKGQSYEIIVDYNNSFITKFHILHEKNYGYSIPDKKLEIVNIRVRAKGMAEKPVFKKQKSYNKQLFDDAVTGNKKVIFNGKEFKTRLILRDKLINGNVIDGPVIILEYSSTLIIPPFAYAMVDEYANLIVHLN